MDTSTFRAAVAAIAFIFCISSFQLTYAQDASMRVDMNINLKVDTTKVRLYEMRKDESDKVKTVTLRMNYGSAQILNPEDAAELNEGGCNILSVDVVYTDFKNEDVQDILNKKRVAELYFLCPDVFNQKMVDWNFVEQLGYATEDGAKKLFHGIVIKYLKVPFYKPESPESMFGDLSVESIGDTSLFPILEKHIKFDEELICVDLTGSMSPYYIQVFTWLHLKHNKQMLNFSFFNDGDMTPDYLKRAGRVGGVYLCKTNSIDTITNYAFKCISNGFGGDTPENNVESVIKGLEKYPKTKQVVMLADNWADMRDYSFMSKIDKPVKVIVCGMDLFGVKKPINTQYLDLARRTKGSVHTMEDDILDLALKREGDEITIDGVPYVIRGGRFMMK
ncbi:MAG: hypothetical protein GC178_02330 [Flavobacteriales bacterium]|nr:hypothetical protein [Flavobacteriales bacterium]